MNNQLLLPFVCPVGRFAIDSCPSDSLLREEKSLSWGNRHNKLYISDVPTFSLQSKTKGKFLLELHFKAELCGRIKNYRRGNPTTRVKSSFLQGHHKKAILLALLSLTRAGYLLFVWMLPQWQAIWCHYIKFRTSSSARSVKMLRAHPQPPVSDERTAQAGGAWNRVGKNAL